MQTNGNFHRLNRGESEDQENQDQAIFVNHMLSAPRQEYLYFAFRIISNINFPKI